MGLNRDTGHVWCRRPTLTERNHYTFFCELVIPRGIPPERRRPRPLVLNPFSKESDSSLMNCPPRKLRALDSHAEPRTF